MYIAYAYFGLSFVDSFIANPRSFHSLTANLFGCCGRILDAASIYIALVSAVLLQNIFRYAVYSLSLLFNSKLACLVL